MKTRRLGKTEVELTEVALGTWGLSGAYGPVSASLFQQTIDAAVEAGVRTFDVAPLWGEAEARLGEALEARRDEVQLITRAGVMIDDEQDVLFSRFDAESLRADLEGSLERLRSKHIDVWMLHDPPEEALQEDDVWELAKELKEKETIRAFGVGCRGVDEARVALTRGADAIALTYNLLRREALQDLESDLEHHGAGVLARSPLFHGLLTGRWTEYRQFAKDDHRAARWEKSALGLRVRQVNRLRFLVHDQVPNLSAAALRFVLHHPRVSCALLGARRPVQISGIEGLAGEAPYLPEEDIERLEGLLSELGT